MPIEILMPALSPTMTEGNLAKWHKREGDAVKAGDVIAEIETDKATMEVEAVDEGTLGRILVPEGAQGVKVNAPIALLLGEGEDSSAATAPQPPGAPPAAMPAHPPQPQQGATASAESRTPQPGTPKMAPQREGAAAPPAAGAAPQAPTPAAQQGNGAARGERILASPLAKRMAAQAGLDLRRVTGSGPHGRIVKSDIQAALGGGVAAPMRPAAQPQPQPGQLPPRAPLQAPGPVSPAQLPGLPAFVEQPHSMIRKTIARRLSEGVHDLPYFHLSLDCTIDELMKIRQALNSRSDQFKLSVNDFVIRAAALALRQKPQLNASWTDTALRLYQSVDISVAVAMPNGLITPVIRNADQKGLAVIANEMKDLAARGRDGKLKPEEYQGGTFSVSNLGMFGIREFTAVINPPQAAILAVGVGEKRPVVKDGALAVATVMSCTLTVDHRVADGVSAAEWFAVFKKLIEDPLAMLL